MSDRLPIVWPEVLADLPARGPVCIEASAGTGKTYTLEHLLLKLILEEGVPIEKVLVVTFTEKATLELVARLRERLLETRQTLAAQGKKATPATREALRRVEQALRSYDRASIKTIHGFCQEILADGAMPAGMLLEQHLVAPHTVAREVLLEVVRRRVTGDDATGLALRTFLTRHGFEALQAFHAALAGERGSRVPAWDLSAFRTAIPDDYPTAEEIEAWGLETMKAAKKARPLLVEGFQQLPAVIESFTDDLAALSANNAWQLWGAECGEGKSSRRKAFDALRGKVVKKGVAPLDHPVGEKLCEILDLLLERAPAPAAYLADHLFDEVKEKASARKRALGLLDYDDMLLRLDEALEGEPGEALVSEVRARFSWVLIDEFQDTDALQWRIFSRLFGEASPPGSGDSHRIVVVGDPKQAIYGFRGGDLPVYLEARRSMMETGNPPLQLTTSYRSTPRLLQVLGPLFETDYFDDAELTAPPLGHGPRHDALTDAAGHELPPVTLLAAPHDTGCWPHKMALTRQALHRALVAELVALLDPERGVRYRRGEGEARALRPSDCMVLCLTRSECEAVGQALATAGVPHAFFKQDGLSRSAEAEHLRLLLSALAAPHDASARARLWLTPFFELPLSQVEAARELPETHPLHARIDHWCELAAARRFEALFDAVLVESGLRRRLAYRGDERALTNYLHLCERLLEGARAEPLTVDELPQLLRGDEGAGSGADDADVRRLETERDAVQILTLHKAKGLEAPVVLLGSALLTSRRPGRSPFLDTSCGIFHQGSERFARLPPRYLDARHPTTEAQIDAETRGEQQRLFYVAATRARARLVLPAALPLDSEHPEAQVLGDAGSASGRPLFFSRGYDPLNARLVALAGDPELAPLFSLRPLASYLDASAPEARASAPRLAPLPEEAPALDAERLRETRKAPVLTSYSRMKRGTDGLAPTELSRQALLDDSDDFASFELEPDPILPGGTRTGLFLHSLLEEADFEQVATAESLEAYAGLPGLLERAERLARRHDLPAAAALRGLELTYTTLRRPLVLGAIELPAGLCQVRRQRPELSFVYPIPEKTHPLLTAAARAPAGPDPLPFRAERGFVTGFIDLVFESEGKIFFLDWKSDRVPDYRAEALAEHVAQRYELQARLYTLAVTRLFGIEDAKDYEARFGGLSYLYLRGTAPDGLFFERPEWSELMAWESGLLTHADRAVSLASRGATP